MLNPAIKKYINEIVNQGKQEIIAGDRFKAVLVHAYVDLETQVLSYMRQSIDEMMETNETKQAMVLSSCMSALIRLHKNKELLQAAILISEAFLSQQEMTPEHKKMKDKSQLPKNHGYIPASEAPNRKEGLLVICCTKDKATMEVHFFDRGVNGIEFLPPQYGLDEHECPFGAMTKLFPEILKKIIKMDGGLSSR